MRGTERDGARLALAGELGFETDTLPDADVTIPYDLICFHELTVTAGFASNPQSWRRAMALLSEVNLEPLGTEVVPLRDWRRAFEASRAGEGVKYVLDPR